MTDSSSADLAQRVAAAAVGAEPVRRGPGLELVRELDVRQREIVGREDRAEDPGGREHREHRQADPGAGR
jgi:hypothetical protein